jgi:hypothetical protein
MLGSGTYHADGEGGGVLEGREAAVVHHAGHDHGRNQLARPENHLRRARGHEREGSEGRRGEGEGGEGGGRTLVG